MSGSSIAKRPAVSMMTTSFNIWVLCSTALRAISTGFAPGVSSENTGISICLPTTCNWVIAAGRYTSAATSIGCLPCLRKYTASLPAVVVLPAPCKPTSMMIVGGLEAIMIRLCVPPKSAVNSSFTILITVCAGFKDPNTSSPSAFSLMVFTKSFATIKLTSASRRAVRT